MIAIPELGFFALILALVSAVALAGIGVFGAQRNVAPGVLPGAMVVAMLVLLAFAVLAWSFLDNDFSLRIVADNSNTQLPARYRFAATWGSHEGSLLLWAMLLTWWTVAVAVAARGLKAESRARAVGVMAAVAAGFLAFLVFASNPFVRLFPAPIEGRDLNPLLQDPAMVLHPPLLYMGYVGFSVVFAFALTGLIERRLDPVWARWLRPWTEVAWAFLTLGIVLGSRWAYYELGWGGWWFWDPVENASFMPWLCGTALVHTLAVTDARGEMKKWTLLLAILTFSLSLLGTFLVRSGVLTSVHAFAIDPLRGVFILGFLAVVVGGSLALYAWRAPSIEPGPGFSVVSRETLLLLNNLLLAVAAGIVLLGTLYPLVVDALGLGKISIGPPYFNAVFVPLAVPVLFLMGVGPLARWRRASVPDLGRRLRWAAAAAGIAAVVSPAIAGEWQAGAALGFGLAAWTLVAAVTALAEASRGRWPPRRVVGMALAHAGLAVFVFGVTCVTHYEERRELKMAPGDTVRLGEHVFRFNGTETVFGPNWVADRAIVDVERGGIRVAQLFPEKRRYHASGITLTESAIDAGIGQDLFVALGEPLAEGAWTVRLHRKPLVEWIFAGFAIMALGGFIAASDRRLRRGATEKAATAVESQSPA